MIVSLTNQQITDHRRNVGLWLDEAIISHFLRRQNQRRLWDFGLKIGDTVTRAFFTVT